MQISNLKGLNKDDLDFVETLFTYWLAHSHSSLKDTFISFHNALIDTGCITCDVHRGDAGKYTRAGITYLVNGYAVTCIDIHRPGIKLLFYRAGLAPYRDQNLVWYTNKDWSGHVYLTPETYNEAVKCATESAALRMNSSGKADFLSKLPRKGKNQLPDKQSVPTDPDIQQANASIKSIIRTIAPAVFIRNHEIYIEEACTRNSESQLRQTTFRSSKTWANAQFALEQHKVLTCYLAPIGGDNMVQYQAVIHQIQLHPKLTNPITQELLSMELDATKKEGLWESEGKAVNTLYTITHCEKLTKPFSITELVKIDGNEPISENYGYGYSLVYEHAQPVDEVLLISPEETPYESELYEGTPRKASIMARQRSAAARQKCLDQYGYVCSICAFDFEARYGTLGKGFIHVHHLNPMAKSKERRKVNPLEDLRPICPNCHAMIHHRDPELSITELKSMLNKKL